MVLGQQMLKSILNIALKNNPNLRVIKGDIRDRNLLEKEIANHEIVVHLACISNDPSFELNPKLGKSINLDAFTPLVEISKKKLIKKFIYASSSSVYGIKSEKDVHENISTEPLTDYSKYKAMCEDVLLAKKERGFTPLILRPATVCGYSPRLRLDLTVNILTNHAVNNRKITVFGGDQKRPNIHIDDVTDLYVNTLQWPDELIDCNIFNAGYENHTVMQLAEMVKSAVGGDLAIDVEPTDDLRSYHVSSDKMREELGFEPRHSIHRFRPSCEPLFQLLAVPI